MSADSNLSPPSTGSEAPASPTEPAAAPVVRAPNLILMVLAGILGVLLSWQLIGLFGSTFRAPAALMAEIKYPGPTPEQSAKLKKYAQINEYENWPLRFAIFGGLLGGCLSGAAARSRSASPALIGAISGAVLGGVAGAVVAALNQFLPGDEELSSWSESYQASAPIFRMVLIHAAGFAVAGIGVGWAVALGTGGRGLAGRCVLHGLAAGLLGGMLFAPVSAVLMPNVEEHLYPLAGGSRLLWLALPGLPMTFALAVGLKPKPAKT